jgi:serine protease Do
MRQARSAALMVWAVPWLAFGAATATPPVPSFAGLVDSVKASVINVEVAARAPKASEETPDDLFQWFLGPQGQERRNVPQRPPQYRQGAGSGFIIDGHGLALTNNHVVEGAVAIHVKLEDGRQFEAKVLGRDPLTDVALIQLQGDLGQLPVARLGDSDALKVGDWVIAIGNPFGLASSVSAGIISARARDIHAGPYDDFLQTDAAINPGNSGGPLFDLKGEVVGINTAIVGGGSGIGFAVPSSLVKALLPQLERTGAVTRGYMGIYVQDLTPDLAKALGVPATHGAVVTQVTSGSPADKAGLKADDVVVTLDGQEVTSAGTLTRAVALKQPAAKSVLALYRGSKRSDVSVTLGTRPDLEHVQAQNSPEPGDTGRKLGVTLQDADPSNVPNGMPTRGAVVTSIEPGSPAERAELLPGMMVVQAAGKPVNSARDMKNLLKDAKPGSAVLLRVAIPGTDTRLLRALRIP